MSELTAALLQLSEHAERIAVLDAREAEHWRQAGEQLAELAAQLGGVQGRAEDQGKILAGLDGLDVTVVALAEQLAALSRAGDGGAKGYQPVPAPRWWRLEGQDRQEAVGRLRAWVATVFRPEYGHLAASLGSCWEQHPLCLYLLDWLSELWSVLYLTASRGPATLAGQADWQTRLLPAAAAQLAAETSRCDHARDQGPAVSRLLNHHPADQTRTGGAP
jgi:hypothetical protein